MDKKVSLGKLAHSGHFWFMVLIVVIAAGLFIKGAGAIALFPLVLVICCTVMMVAMMFMMDNKHKH